MKSHPETITIFYFAKHHKLSLYIYILLIIIVFIVKLYFYNNIKLYFSVLTFYFNFFYFLDFLSIINIQYKILKKLLEKEGLDKDWKLPGLERLIF
jgi:hypothetical protein